MLIGPPDMSGTVQRFAMAGVALRTYSPDTTLPGGLIAAGATVDEPIAVHVFPAKGQDIARLELQSVGAVLEVHDPIRGRLRAVTKSQDRASVIIWQSKTYEVKALGEWWGGSDGSKGYQQAWVQEVTR